MSKRTTSTRKNRSERSLPLIVEKDEDGFYIIECPVLPGCYTQGKTLDQALRNIEEVIELICEDEDAREILKNYSPQEISFHAITITI